KDQNNDEPQCILQWTMRRPADVHEDVPGTIAICRCPALVVSVTVLSNDGARKQSTFSVAIISQRSQLPHVALRGSLAVAHSISPTAMGAPGEGSCTTAV